MNTHHSARRSTFSALEALEPRIAPAAVFTVADHDGDQITIRSSVGTNADLASATHVSGGHLQLLDLSSATYGNEFKGADLTISVVRGPHGDGHVNVGYVNATGIDLGSVRIAGDLGRIVAGDNVASTPGVKLLNVDSLGRLGTDTQAVGGSVASSITGALSRLAIVSDLGGSLELLGGASAKLGSAFIGGSIVGTEAKTGQLIAAGDIGDVTIGHDLQGGYGSQSGGIYSGGKIHGITIGGSLLGGGNSSTGTIAGVLEIGSIKIAHNLVGGTADTSGFVGSGKLGKLIVGGSVLGGNATHSGSVEVNGSIGSVAIAHDLAGGGGNLSGVILTLQGDMGSVNIAGSVRGSLLNPGNHDSGEILAGGSIQAIHLGHDLIGGVGANSGAMQSGVSIGSITIGGSILGCQLSSATGENAIVTAALDIGPVLIGHDIVGGATQASGAVAASQNLGAVTVGGSVLGGAGLSSGTVFGSTKVGTVHIGGNLVGGGGMNSGRINSYDLSDVTIGGSLLGGTNSHTGEVASSRGLGKVIVGHDMIGGTAVNSGALSSLEGFASIQIGGSLIGGTANQTGFIHGVTEIGAINIGHDLRGGSITGNASLQDAGAIVTAKSIGLVTIGGSILAGFDNSTGALSESASIAAGDSLAGLVVHGSIIGTHTSSGDGTVVIAANGQAVQGATSDVAIGKIQVSGRVEHTNFLAGYRDGAPLNGDAQIGAVQVGGDWVASNLVAGVMAGVDGMFGDGDDQAIPSGGPNIVSKIASIVIGGRVTGTSGGSDHFGFTAQQIGSFHSQGFTAPLTAGNNATLKLDVPTADVSVREL